MIECRPAEMWWWGEDMGEEEEDLERGCKR